MQRIQINPRFDVLYYSFYLQGLRQVSPHAAYSYSCQDFPPLDLYTGFAFVLEDGDRPPLRVWIDAGDGTRLDGPGLAWCDTYAKVNVDSGGLAPAQRAKVLTLGPSYGVRIWSAAQTPLHALRTYYASHPRLDWARTHFANYWRQWRYRQAERAYVPAPSSPDYIFFTGSLWKDEPHTNAARAAFIRACRDLPDIRFEGGFAPRRNNDIPGFTELILAQPYALPHYLARLQRSAVAFNTPAVCACLGWKLGEFLALGKAIISTPLARDLPSPLIHGEHIHYVDGSAAAIQQAVRAITQDSAYRRHLEQNARRYYDAYLSPTSVIQQVLRHAHQGSREG